MGSESDVILSSIAYLHSDSVLNTVFGERLLSKSFFVVVAE